MQKNIVLLTLVAILLLFASCGAQIPTPLTGKILEDVQNGFTFSDKDPDKGKVAGEVNLNLEDSISNVTDLVVYYGKDAESDRDSVGSTSTEGFESGSIASLEETEFTGEERLFLFLRNSAVTEGTNEVYSGVSLSVVDSIEEEEEEEVVEEVEEVEELAETISLKNALFDYDKAILKEEDKAVLDNFVNSTDDLSSIKVVIAGHADERGSNEYNLALGERRALVVKNYLILQGVPSQNIRTLSYGEERPACNQSRESCWSKNRRAETQAGQ